MISKYENLISLLEMPNKEVIELQRIFSLSEIKRLSNLNDLDISEPFKSCTVLVKDRIYHHAKYAGLVPHDFS